MTQPPGTAPTVPAPVAAPVLALTEFVALMAMLVATIAFSIDAMLPALPQIGAELAPGSANAAQLVVVTFLLGMGIGTLVVGPLSDAVGRRPVILGGAVIYCAAATLAAFAPSLETLVIARLVQGLGASGPRVASQAMIRDLYAGRGMARVSSFVMMVFTLAPAVAPLIGSFIIAGFGWRGVFAAFVLFSAVSASWMALRQPETLPPARRRPLDIIRLRAAAAEVVGHPMVRRAIAVQTLIFGVLFATIASIQPIYERAFDRADSFPLWFGVIALISAGASFANARLVGRLGMVWLLLRALSVFAALSGGIAVALWFGALPTGWDFAVFLVWQMAAFSLVGLSIGNLQALAMQPMGHVAGMASSVISSVSTVLGVALAIPVGLSFDGTPMPLYLGAGLFGAGAWWLARGLREAGA